MNAVNVNDTIAYDSLDTFAEALHMFETQQERNDSIGLYHFESEVADVHWADCKWENVTFFRYKLRGVSFRRVHFRNVCFVDIELSNVSFFDLTLEKCTWYNTQASNLLLGAESFCQPESRKLDQVPFVERGSSTAVRRKPSFERGTWTLYLLFKAHGVCEQEVVGAEEGRAA